MRTMEITITEYQHRTRIKQKIHLTINGKRVRNAQSMGMTTAFRVAEQFLKEARACMLTPEEQEWEIKR